MPNISLTEWTATSRLRQRELIVKFYKEDQWEDYEGLAHKAANELRNTLIAISEITNVQPGGGDVVEMDKIIPIRELILHVITVLPESHKIKHLPSRFAGFDVKQENLGDKRDSFLSTWKRLFYELKGWDEEKTLKWAEKRTDALSGREPSAIYHYGPIKTALSSLVDEKIKESVGDNLHNLLIDIRNVIEKTEGDDGPRIQHPDTVVDYDWENVRRRIKELIQKHTK